MANTTDMSDNAAIAVASAEEAAVEKLLSDTATIAEQMELDYELNASSTAVTDAGLNQPTDTNPTPITTTTPQPTQPSAQPSAAAPPTATTNTPTPSAMPPNNLTPSRVGTPSFHANGNGTTSRAASVQAEASHAIPIVANKHGAPARQWLNEHVTRHLLEAVKKIGVEQPENPLRAMAEFFDQRATEMGQ